MRENKRLFSHCRDRRPRLSVIFFFQAKKKEAKKSLATTTAAVSQAPQRFLVREKINACFLTVGAVVPDCPNKMAAGASHRPTKEVVGIWQNEIILFMLYYLLLPETTI